MSYPKLAFIGAGNMAQAIIGGLLEQGYPAANIYATSPDTKQLKELELNSKGVQLSTNNKRAAAEADIVLLAVKPQILSEVCQELANIANKHQLFISIAAGIMTQTIERWLAADLALIRTMPNTPALVQEGATALFANAHVSAEQRQQAETIFNAIGLAVWVEKEAQLDAVTAVSGSGPAYFFLLLEQMIKAGVKQGLSESMAKQLALQTALGAASMALKSSDDPAQLRRKVTSPNGTTEQAIKTFLAGDFEQLVENALQACHDRSAELALELDQK